METSNSANSLPQLVSAFVKYDGQDIPIDPAIALDDETLIKALVPFFPEVSTASITRAVKGDTLEITLSKRAGHKGTALDELFDCLRSAKERINPAVLAYSEWRQREQSGDFTIEEKLEMLPQIEEAIETGTTLHGEVNNIFTSIARCKPVPSRQVPIGF